MARTQVNYGQNNPDALVPNQRRLNDPGLRPAANPVESFVNPVNTLDRNAGAKAQQLAQALSSLAPGLMQYAAQAQQRKNDRMSQEGQNAAAEAARQGMTYKEAVDKGLIKRVDNPFFVAGAKEQFGRLAADQMANDLKLVLSEQLKDESDPQKVEAALQEAQKTWMAGNLGDNSGDRNFQTGFSLRASVHMEETRASLLQRAQTNMLQRSDAAIFAEASNAIKDSIGKGLTYEDIAGDLNFLKESMVAQGRSKDAVDKALLKAVGEAMLTDGAQDLSPLFDLVKSTSGLSLRDSQGDKSAEYVRGVVQAHTQMWINNQQKQRQIQNWRESDAKDAVASEVLGRILENPRADIKDLVEKVRMIPGGAETVLKAVQAATTVNNLDDPEAERELYAKVWEGSLTKANVLEEMGRRRIDVQTANRLMSEIEQRDNIARQKVREARADERAAASFNAEVRRQYRDLVSDPLLTAQLANTKAQFKDPAGAWVTKDAAARADYALAALRKSWIEWQQTPEGAKADPATKVEWLQRQSTAIIAPLNAVEGSKYSGKKAPIPSSLPSGFLGSSGNETSGLKPKAPMVSYTDIAAVKSTGRPSQALRDAMKKAGIPPTPEAMAKFVREQEALLRQQKGKE